MFSVKNYIFIALIFIVSTACYSQLAGTPGAFSRMGFGARGMGMGNALTAVRDGELSGFYNPAIVPFARQQNVSVSYSFLSLDRHLNAVYYTQPLDTNAGLSFGFLNSGVRNIDGRDGDGFHTENYATTEDLFTISFGLKIRKIVIGITPKLYYNKLFTDFSSNAFGFDFGIVYPASQHLTFTIAVKDFNAKYKWDSSVLYNELGNSTTENFPVRKIFAAAYSIKEMGLVAAEIEANGKAIILRAGAEYTPVSYLTIRGGFDGWNTKDAQQAHPSFGFTVHSGYTEYNPSLNYAYVIEPYGLFSIHVVSISVTM